MMSMLFLRWTDQVEPPPQDAFLSRHAVYLQQCFFSTLDILCFANGHKLLLLLLQKLLLWCRAFNNCDILLLLWSISPNSPLSYTTPKNTRPPVLSYSLPLLTQTLNSQSLCTVCSMPEFIRTNQAQCLLPV